MLGQTQIREAWGKLLKKDMQPQPATTAVLSHMAEGVVSEPFRRSHKRQNPL
jgi:hypothetical protein